MAESQSTHFPAYLGRLDTPSPADLRRAGTFTSGKHRAYKPSPVRYRAMRDFVFERDAYTCQRCGTTELPLELDHIKPYSKGGHFVHSNLQVLCTKCNVNKHNHWGGDPL